MVNHSKGFQASPDFNSIVDISPSSPEIQTALDLIASRNVRPASLIVAVVCLCNGLFLLIVFPETPLFNLSLNAFLVLLSLGLYILWRVHPFSARWAPYITTLLIIILISDNFLQAPTISLTKINITFTAFIIGLGFAFFSTRWFLLNLTLSLMGWGGIAWWYYRPAGMPFTLTTLLPISIAIIVYIARKNSFRQIEVLRLGYEQQAKELETLLEKMQKQLADQQQLTIALHESESVYRAMFERNLAVKLLIDPESGKIVDANPAACQFYGYSRAELQQMAITDINILPPQQVYIEMARARSEERNYFIFKHRLASGEIRDVEVLSSPLKVRGQSLLFSIIHDITVRQEMEKAVRTSEEKHRTLLEGIQTPILALRSDMTIVYANQAYAAMAGKFLAELEGKNLLQVLPTVERAEAYTAYVEAMRTGKVQQVMVNVEECHWHVWVNPVPWGVLGWRIDVTEQFRAQEKVRYQANLLQNVSDAIVSTDIEFCIQSWNGAAVKLYGWQESEVLGKRTAEVLKSRFLNGLDAQESMTQRLRRQGHWQGEVQQVKRDGGEIYVFSSVSLLQDSAGTPIGIVAVNRDITQRRQAEQDLQYRIALEQLVAQISTNVANAPLSQVDRAIEEALATTCQFAGLDRANLFLLSQPDPPMVRKSHSWCKHPTIKPIEGINLSQFNWLRQNIVSTPYVRVIRSAEVPAEALPEKQFFQAHQIQLFVSVPLKGSGSTLGWLILDSITTTQVWGERFIEMLSFIGDILANALDRQQTERALRESEERFRELVETVNIVPFETEKNSYSFCYVGPQATKLLGYPLSEWYTTNFWVNHIHPEDRSWAIAYCVESSVSRSNYEFEYRMVAADGHTVWVRDIVTVQTDSQGLFTLRGFFIDITERKQAAEAYQKLVEQSLQGLLILQDKEIVFINQTAVQILGYSLTELKAKSLKQLAAQLISPAEQRRSGQLIQALLEGNVQINQYELQIYHPSGEQRWIEIAYSLIEYRGRKALQVMMVDITKRLQTEEALRRSQKLESLGVLAGGVAHDFNNLLVGMLGQTSLAQAKLEAGHPALSHIEKAVRAAERATLLTRQLLAYSGQGRFEVTTVDLNALVQENLHLFEVAISKNVRFELQLADLLPCIEADPGQIQQVIMNLILNGAEAIGNSAGTVTIETNVQTIEPAEAMSFLYMGKPLSPGKYVKLRVKDTGCGMDANTLSRIFDPFFSTKFTGRGLGLAAVLGIVRGHHGGLMVQSQVGDGTVFELVFPVNNTQKSDEEANFEPFVPEEKGVRANAA